MKTSRLLKHLTPIVVVFLLLLGYASVKAQSKSYRWEHFDVEIVVQENGDLLVTERHTLTFEGEEFTYGYRAVSTGSAGNNDEISDVTVREGDIVYQLTDAIGQPYTFRLLQGDDQVEIYWYFPPTVGTHNYTISYLARRAIRTAPSGDQVLWNALPGDLGAYVENSTVMILLPEGIQAGLTTAQYDGREDTGHIQTEVSNNGQRVTFRLLQPRSPGDNVEVGVRFASGQLELAVPVWQQAEQQADVITLTLLVISGILAVGGPLTVLLLWYRFGRDPQVGPMPDYLTEPPDDLPPAVVGTLVDETAHVHDIMSTLVDLARRGYLTMREMGHGGDHTFERTDKPLDDLRPFERELVDSIFQGAASRDLYSLRYKFAKRLPEIRSKLYAELQNRGYVRTSPHSVRTSYGCLSTGLFGLAAFAFLGMGAIFGSGTVPAICPAIALALTGVVMTIAGNYMPAKTAAGAEAAAKWLAFKKYLSDIEKYKKLEDATAIFEQYLPYAITFGIDRSWIRKFSSIPSAPTPPWYVPVPHHHDGGRDIHDSPTRGRQGGTAGPVGNMPSLEGLSGGLTGGLATMSDSLTRMLTNTQTVLQSTQPSSGGKSGSFSGGFVGGSSGGGSGRFG